MKLQRFTCICLLLFPLTLHAQEGVEDPIEAAIRAFNERKKNEPNEVIVVLPDPETAPTEGSEPKDSKPGEETPPEDGPTAVEPPAHADLGPEAVPPPDAPPSGEQPAGENKPVLVTGKPPRDPAMIDVANGSKPDAGVPPEAPGAERGSPRESIRIRVDKVRDGSGKLDPSKVKLLAPFPPKPLMEPPTGWHLDSADEAPAFEREVELAPGKTITLSIPPHVLAPDADGKDYFAVQEPGFQASQGYRQSDTVPAILSKSIQQLESDSKQIGAVVDRLQELLVALPKPEGAKPLPGVPNPKHRKP